MHYIASVILIYLPQDSVQKSLFFCILSFIPDSSKSFVLSIFSAVYILTSVHVRLTQSGAASQYILENEALSIQPHNVRKELIESLCALQKFTSGTIYKNVIIKTQL